MNALPDRLQTALDTASAADPADRSGAHLAEFAFRFGPEPAPVSAETRPAPGAAWTLAQTLQELRLRHIALVETSRGVRPRHGRLVDRDLARAVAQHAGPLRVWLRLGVGAGHVSAPWGAGGWDDATRLRAAWFGLLFEPPALPVDLRPGERVTDWARFRAGVAARLAAGPDAPGAERLRDDLALLYARYAAPAERVYVPVPVPSVAA